MSPRGCQVPLEFVSDVQSDETMGTRSLYESFRQGGCALLPRVRRIPNSNHRLNSFPVTSVFLFATVDVLTYWANVPITGWWILLTGTLEYIPVFTLTPRFILSVRALYARDLQDPRKLRDMDTDFGSGCSFSGSGSVTLVTNVGKSRGTWSQQYDEIQMEEM